MQSDWKEEFVALLQAEWKKMKKDGENDKNDEFLQIQEMLQRLEGKVDRLNARLTSLEREARPWARLSGLAPLKASRCECSIIRTEQVQCSALA